jgi:hypothetical protein
MKNYPTGIFYNEPHPNAPDFVLASISIRPDVFIEWLKEQETNEKGYVRLQAKRGNEGKPYLDLDNYIKTRSEVVSDKKQDEANEEILARDIPF